MLVLETPPSARAERQAWQMFVGENIAGKSYIFQAVDLALLGQEGVDRLKLDARKFVMHGASGSSRQGTFDERKSTSDAQVQSATA
jgi:hypothetical protein